MTYQRIEEKKVYLVGPMTGLPKFNRAAFDKIEKRLKEQGFQHVLTPANEAEGLNYESYYMAVGFLRVKEADALIALEGWEHSPGARREILAAFEQNKVIYRIGENENGRIVLDELIDMVFEKKIESTRPFCCGEQPTFWVNEHGQYYTLNLLCEKCSRMTTKSLSRRNISFSKIQLVKLALINEWKENYEGALGENKESEKI